MILITGATGFIGRALVRQLAAQGKPVRALFRPSRQTPRLPKGAPVEAALVSLSDLRGLRAALRGVETVIHLASAESQGARGDLTATDIVGTRNLVAAADDAGVDRFVYLSHLGAAASSAYPAFRAKGYAEEAIRKGKTPYLIFRSSLAYGPEDRFTNSLAALLRYAPGAFPIPSGGRVVVQPVWVEDLATCILWSLDREEARNQTYEIGGSEFFTLRQIVEIIMEVSRRRRLIVSMSPIALRGLTLFLESVLPGFPISSLWMDYFAVNRTCAVDSMPRVFGLTPARFAYRLEYLSRKLWYEQIWEYIRRR